jgi:signal transduction histidine kinase
VGDETSLERICAAHTRIIPAESYTSLKTENERFRAVIRWQQKAQALESEIAERQKAQEALQQREAELADLLTEQKRMEQALRASVDQARAAVRARDDFLSIAAHELRTPVTALKGSAQLLARRQARGELTEGRLRPALAVIEDRANHLARLTSDLLDVSRLQGGQMALACTDLDLASLVQHAVRLARDQVDGKRVLDVSLPSQPTVVWGDAGRLDQVLTNLLDNALKYSPTEEPVTIHLDADADHELRLTVRDRGIGIPEGFLDQIFEPFGRAPNVAANHLPGMGLGLSICRRIVEQHGGRIWAESPGEGRGTTIVVCLPRYSSVTPMPQGS